MAVVLAVAGLSLALHAHINNEHAARQAEVRARGACCAQPAQV
jgi:hypothetical protein